MVLRKKFDTRNDEGSRELQYCPGALHRAGLSQVEGMGKSWWVYSYHKVREAW